MVTQQIFIKGGNRELARYFRSVCSDSRKMYNCALFYLRNFFTGVSKPKWERSESQLPRLTFHKSQTGLAEDVR